MYKKILNLSKTISVGILWFFVFSFIYRFVALNRWNFDIINGRHWGKLVSAWEKGWIVNTFQEWVFVLFLVSALPIFLASWAFLLFPSTEKKVIHFFSIVLRVLFPFYDLHRVWKEKREESKETKQQQKVVKKQILSSTLTNGDFPTEIFSRRVESEAEAYLKHKEKAVEEKKINEQDLPPHTEVVSERHHEATHHTHAVKEKSEPQKSDRLDDILARLDKHHQKKDESTEDKKEPLKKKLSSLGKNFVSKGYHVFEDIKIGEQGVALLALGQHKIIVGEFLDQATDWVVDETVLDGMPAMWTSPHGAIESPVQKVIEARRSLKKLLIDVLDGESIEAIVCLTKGTISNLDDVKSNWRRESVQVMNASKDAKTPFLKGLQDYLTEKIPPMGEDKIKKIKKILGI
ncbi:MAG: hypothetical protein JXR30_00050 [Alphaproteobacteria bacterium]|nr:hypothetical protein [Alphaproteobacteria bacterium]